MAKVIAIAGFLSAVLCAGLARLLAEELREWTPWIVERIIKKAVAILPVSKRDRYAEEWRSHINDLPGCIAKLIVALGLPFAAKQISGWQKAALIEDALRRALEIVFAAVYVLLVAPVFVVSCVGIRMEGEGPILRRSRRIGRHALGITLLSFRTQDICTIDSHFVSASARPTRVGKFLRRFGIDILPNVFNVLRGDLALVGPRPRTRRELVYLYHYRQDAIEILSVKPGLFYSGFDATHPLSELQSDLQYLKNRSLLLDLKIILQQMKAVLSWALEL